jgi:carbon starvation protein
MQTLLIAIGAGVAFLIAYFTYGRWLGRKVFNLTAGAVCPAHRLRDDKDYVPTGKSIVFGHHFTSIAGTGPIVGPAIAVMWGWLPALLWVVFGSIFIGAVHDFGSLVVSLRNNGQTVGDIAGRVLNRRARLLFLFVLFLALTIVIAIFGLVIAAVFRMYPAAIFPCLVQIPLSVAIGLWLHRKGANLLIPSIIALGLMYLSVIYGNVNMPFAIPGWGQLHLLGIDLSFHGWAAGEWGLAAFNTALASMSTITWVALLLAYSYVASVIPVWVLLQPRDYINSLQLLTALGLVVCGLGVAAFAGGAPPVEGADRPALEIAAPMWDFSPTDAPLIMPFLFITIACGAISGFHCLVSSGTSSKQLDNENHARFVGFGGMLTEGFLATLVILACVAGLGMGTPTTVGVLNHPLQLNRTVGQPEGLQTGDNTRVYVHVTRESYEARFYKRDNATDEFSESHTSRGEHDPKTATFVEEAGVWVGPGDPLVKNVDSDPPNSVNPVDAAAVGTTAWNTRYSSWTAAGSLGAKVGAFVDGAGNFLAAMGIPIATGVALMGVLVASFAGTTLDTACRLQRYIVQELAGTLRVPGERRYQSCVHCGYDLTSNVSGTCPECGWEIDWSQAPEAEEPSRSKSDAANPILWLTNKHAATIFALLVGGFIASLPSPNADAWTWATAGSGGLILWPLFGATNQLLGGLAFLVIGFYLWRRSKPVWLLVFPLIFMLIMPAWALLWQMFIEAPGADTGWFQDGRWILLTIGLATLALEAWTIVEAVLLWPRVKGVLEDTLPGAEPEPALQPATVTETA